MSEEKKPAFPKAAAKKEKTEEKAESDNMQVRNIRLDAPVYSDIEKRVVKPGSECAMSKDLANKMVKRGYVEIT
jgi:hypothetical protein